MFPHPREAIRAWWAHRTAGEGASSRDPGAVAGKKPTVSDLLRVGDVLWGLRRAGKLTPQQARDLIDYARGIRPRSADAEDGKKELEVLVAMVSRHLRKYGIVAVANPRPTIRRDEWLDSDGDKHETAYCVDSG